MKSMIDKLRKRALNFPLLKNARLSTFGGRLRSTTFRPVLRATDADLVKVGSKRNLRFARYP